MKFPFTAALFVLLEAFCNYTLFQYVSTLRTRSPFAISHWIVTAFCILLHFVASFKNPGYVNSEQEQAKNQLASQKNDLVNQKIISNQLCKICKVHQQLRTKHCYSCCRCVETFDHHCPILQNCIGRYNRPYFYSYLLLQTIHMIMIQVMILGTFSTKINYYLLVLGTFVFTLLVIFIGLLVMQTVFMLLGITTWEYLCHQDIWYLKGKKEWQVFSDGVLRNVRNYWATSRQNVMVERKEAGVMEGNL